MNIMEIFDQETEGFRDEQDDHSILQANEPRKTRLTLAQLNRLRIMNDVRSLEHEQKLEKVSKQYAAPAAADVGGGGLGL